jgi:hypothetical protein
MNLLKFVKIMFTFNTENVRLLLWQDFVKLNSNWLSLASYKVLYVSRNNICCSRDGARNHSPNQLFYIDKATIFFFKLPFSDCPEYRGKIFFSKRWYLIANE